jgi:hypothetical protein
VLPLPQVWAFRAFACAWDGVDMVENGDFGIIVMIVRQGRVDGDGDAGLSLTPQGYSSCFSTVLIKNPMVA